MLFVHVVGGHGIQQICTRSDLYHWLCNFSAGTACFEQADFTRVGGSTHLPAFCQKSEVTFPFPCWFDYNYEGDTSICYLVHTNIYS